MEFKHKFLANIFKSLILAVLYTFVVMMVLHIRDNTLIIVICGIMFYWETQSYRQIEINEQLSDKIIELEKQLAKK